MTAATISSSSSGGRQPGAVAAQLRRCLASLLERLYGYGSMQDGYYRKVSVILADDTQDADLVAANQAIARAFDAQGLVIHYFGLAEQLELMDSLAGVADLGSIVDTAPRDELGQEIHHAGVAVAVCRFNLHLELLVGIERVEEQSDSCTCANFR